MQPTGLLAKYDPTGRAGVSTSTPKLYAEQPIPVNQSGAQSEVIPRVSRPEYGKFDADTAHRIYGKIACHSAPDMRKTKRKFLCLLSEDKTNGQPA